MNVTLESLKQTKFVNIPFEQGVVGWGGWSEKVKAMLHYLGKEANMIDLGNCIE